MAIQEGIPAPVIIAASCILVPAVAALCYFVFRAGYIKIGYGKTNDNSLTQHSTKIRTFIPILLVIIAINVIDLLISYHASH